MALSFRRHGGEFAVCQLGAEDQIPAWAAGRLMSVTRTPEELSIVCEAAAAPEGVRCEKGWECLELCGPFPFEATGILASFLQPLAEAGVPIFAVSTFNTDWVLIPGGAIEKAVQALRAAGHNEI